MHELIKKFLKYVLYIILLKYKIIDNDCDYFLHWPQSLLVVSRLIVTDHKRKINVANVVLVAYKCFISRLETL